MGTKRKNPHRTPIQLDTLSRFYNKTAHWLLLVVALVSLIVAIPRKVQI